MSKERDLLVSCLDEFQYHKVPCSDLIRAIRWVLAEPEEEGVYQKILRIEDGVEVEILPSELWQDGYEAGKRSVLLSKQPEQGHKFNFDLERMKAAIESPISNVTVDDLAKQVKQEPVAWMWEDKRNETNSWATVFSPVKPDNSVHVKNVVLLYTKEKLEDINGISLRDHFAGLAMQGFISLNKFNTDMSVKLSYDMADAMLAEREKK